MRQMFVFTAGQPMARKHLTHSISNSVPVVLLEEMLSSSDALYFKSLIEDQDGFYAWGAVPGPRNESTWEEMQAGDVVLTTYANHYRFVSSVIGKVNSSSLATRIWGTDDKEQTWQYMYLLSKPQPTNVPVLSIPVSSLLNKGYRGFTKISNEKIEAVLKRYPTLDAFLGTVFGTMPSPTTIERELKEMEIGADQHDSFNPDNVVDGRKRVLAEVVRRRGQPRFRKALLEAYGGKCAVTGCQVESVLEAAHIIAYAGDHTNDVRNGILLRADIHTLFDLGHLKIDANCIIHLDETLTATIYGQYLGKKARLPIDAAKAPHAAALGIKFSQVL